MIEHQGIEFVGDLVHKWYPHDVVVEFEKAEALWEMSQSSGFLFPEPIELREQDSVIVYRNLQVHGNWEPVRAAYVECMTGSSVDAASLGVIAEAGRVLGVIHANLELGTSVPWSPDTDFRRSLERVGVRNGESESPVVSLHADYGFSNVLWSPDKQVIATLDPSPDGYSTFATNLQGPIYVDLGQFISCLEGRVPLHWYPRLKWRRLDQLRGTFIDAYEEASALTVDRERARRFGFAIAEANFRDRMSSRLGQTVGRKVLYNRLKGNGL